MSLGCGGLVQDALKVLGQDLDDGLDVGPQFGHGPLTHRKLFLLRLVLQQQMFALSLCCTKPPCRNTAVVETFLTNYDIMIIVIVTEIAVYY